MLFLKGKIFTAHRTSLYCLSTGDYGLGRMDSNLRAGKVTLAGSSHVHVGYKGFVTQAGGHNMRKSTPVVEFPMGPRPSCTNDNLALLGMIVQVEGAGLLKYSNQQTTHSILAP